MSDKKIEIAVYGKGGIGKSTICANLSAALADRGKKVLQIGCDPKHDSTRLLLGGMVLPTVLEYLKNVPKEQAQIRDILREGYRGIGCIEAGGPKPGVGCAGRGIISAFDFLERNGIKENYDTILYDVLGDVVCGGFAVPIRREYADAIFLVTSGEFMAIYAANNILRGIKNYDGDSFLRVAGIIFNERNIAGEEERIRRFAEAVGLPVCARVPRSNAFAKAEEENCPLMALPEWEKEKRVFKDLAEHICCDFTLYKACPLEDEDLERIVLQEGKNAGTTSVETSTVGERMISDTDVSLNSETDSLFPDLTECRAGKPAAPECSSEEADPPAGCTGRAAENTAPVRRPPLYGCAFTGAATTAVRLEDAVIIAHAPRACAFYTWQNITSPGRKNLFNRGILMPSAICPNFECTEMGQSEAVFGGMDKLKETVKKALVKKPGAVMVISSCVSGIIGDDVLEAENLGTPETPVMVIPSDGDIAGDYMEGIRMCLHKVAKELIRRDAAPRPMTVNLIGEVGVSNQIEVNYRTIKNLLGRMGIGINCRFLGNASVNEVRNFLAAPLNILAHDSLDNQNLKAWLEQNYGCRFFDAPVPVGFEETGKFLEGIGEFFGCGQKVSDIIRTEKERFEERTAALRPVLEGKKILMTTISTSMEWLVSLVRAAGMKFVWIGVLDYLHQGIEITKDKEVLQVTEETFDLLQAEKKVRELKPDIVVSNYTSALGTGDYILDNMPMTQMVGFDAGIEVLERWAEQLKSREEGEWVYDWRLYQKYYA